MGNTLKKSLVHFFYVGGDASPKNRFEVRRGGASCKGRDRPAGVLEGDSGAKKLVCRQNEEFSLDQAQESVSKGGACRRLTEVVYVEGFKPPGDCLVQKMCTRIL